MKGMWTVVAVAMSVSLSAYAESYTSAATAEKLVGRVVKAIAIDNVGTLKSISMKDKTWIYKDMYPMVYSMHGKCLAHGQMGNLVGMDLINLVDADGKKFIKERVQLAVSKGKFWQDYKFIDPLTKKVLPKLAYCEKTGDIIVCAGIYKR